MSSGRLFARGVSLLCLVLATSGAAAAPPVTAAAFAPDGKSVVVGSQAGLEVYSWPDLKTQRKIATELVHIHDLAFSPKGDLLAAAGGKPGKEGTLEWIRWPKGDLARRDTPHKDLIHAVAWRGDGRQLATASADQTCAIHDPESGKLLQTFTGHSRPVLAVCYLPDDKTLVSTGIDQTLRVWEAESGKTVRSLDNHVGTVNALALRPKSSDDAPPMLASASADRTVRLWQPTVGRMVRFTKLASPPLSLAWTPDGSSLLAGCKDGKLRALDPDTGEVLREQAGLEGWLYTLAIPRSGDDVFVAGEEGRLKRLVPPPRQ